MAEAIGELCCTRERFGSPCRSSSSPWEMQRRFQPAPPLAPVATYVPEPPQRSTQAQGQLTFLLSYQPRQGSPQVLLLLLQPFPPQDLLRSLHVRFCLLRDREIIRVMSQLSEFTLSSLALPFQTL